MRRWTVPTTAGSCTVSTLLYLSKREIQALLATSFICVSFFGLIVFLVLICQSIQAVYLRDDGTRTIQFADRQGVRLDIGTFDVTSSTTNAKQRNQNRRSDVIIKGSVAVSFLIIWIIGRCLFPHHLDYRSLSLSSSFGLSVAVSFLIIWIIGRCLFPHHLDYRHRTFIFDSCLSRHCRNSCNI